MSIKASEISDLIKARIEKFDAATEARNVGTVVAVTDGIVRVHGLADVKYGEMLEFPGNTFGLALNLEQDSVGAVVLGEYKHIAEGDTVKTTGRILEVPVGEALLGRVVDALGNPIDGKGPIKATQAPPIERVAPGVDLAQVRQPAGADRLQGDRRDGADRPRPARTDHRRPPDRQDRGRGRHDHQPEGHAALSASTSPSARSRARSRTWCASSKSTARWSTRSSSSASASTPAAMQYIAPYSGCTMGEYFMDQGEDALIIYDDLTKQAWAYRQISLLLRRPPGREAYPGDVFYLHSRLLERSARVIGEYVEKISERQRQGQDRLADGPADHRNAGRRRDGVRADQRDLDHRRPDLPRTDLFNSGIRPADERRHLGVPRRWRGADRHHQEAGRRHPSRARAVPRTRGVLAVCLGPRRGHPQAARARPARDRS